MRQVTGKSTQAGLVLAILVAILAGCSGMLEGKKIDYKSAGKLPPLEVPPDLAAPKADTPYRVPEAGPGTATYSEYVQQRSGRPAARQAAGVLPPLSGARVERGGTQRWLVVRADPEQLWPVVKDFWLENGFLLKVEDPTIGVMETDWAENRANIPVGGIQGYINKALDYFVSLPERDKYRTRLERGSQEGTTEIYVTHRGMAEVYFQENTNRTKWQVRPPDPELEAEFLGKLAVRLGAVDEPQARAFVKATAQAKPRATLKKTDTATVLLLDDGFDRAWRRVGLALDRVGFMVEDRNRADGQYFVSYQDPEDTSGEKRGLSRLAFWRRDEGKKTPDRFLIKVAGADAGGSEVRVLNKEGALDTSGTANRILGLLEEQLR
jgi:outer membrane protein assembly factor BamC